MEKSLFEQVGGTYTQVGDYLLPNLTLTEEAQKSIGIWGQQNARYLKQYHKVIYYMRRCWNSRRISSPFPRRMWARSMWTDSIWEKRRQRPL